MNTYIVYKHTNLLTGKIYIGITKYGDNPNKRWKNGYGYWSNEKFFSDIIKYGWDNFGHEILAANLSETQAAQLERFYIKQFNCINEGYNYSPGGTAPSEKSAKIISRKLKGITRNKISIDKQIHTKEIRYGVKSGIDPLINPLNRKVRCKETGDVFISIQEANNWANTSKVQVCCAGRRAHAGTHPDTKEKLSWEYVDDEDVKITQRKPEKRQTNPIKEVLCVETGIIYKNASEASRKTGVAVSNILRVCKKERKTAGNFHWEFIRKD